MAKKLTVAKLTDEAILRVARIRVTEEGLGDYAQIQHDTQLSVERGVIWMIEWIEFQFSSLQGMAAIAAGTEEDYKAQVTRESKTAMVQGNDSDLVQQHALHAARSAAIGVDAGPLWFVADLIKRYDYRTPMPYAAQSIFVGIDTSHSSAETVDVRIGYTVREVDDQFFFRVASALLG